MPRKDKSNRGELPRFVKDLLSSVPLAGEGVNIYLFRLARVLHAFRTQAEIEALLSAAVSGCGRDVPLAEIRRAVERSQSCAWIADCPDSRLGHPRSPKWPERDLDLIAGVAEAPDAIGIVDLIERSPVRWHDSKPHADEIISEIFPFESWLCVGKTKYQFATRRRDKWIGSLSKFPFIVPSPMTGRFGVTTEGKRSEHSLDNTGPRRFLVIEADDHGSQDQQAARIWYLAKYAPLAVVVFSGGKSLHGWFFCSGVDESLLKRFFGLAICLGFDSATWIRSQFVRIPDGMRENGNRQTVLYFNPEICK